VVQKSQGGGLGPRKLAFFISHGTRWPGAKRVAQFYQCGGGTAGLGLRGAGAADG